MILPRFLWVLWKCTESTAFWLARSTIGSEQIDLHLRHGAADMGLLFQDNKLLLLGRLLESNKEVRLIMPLIYKSITTQKAEVHKLIKIQKSSLSTWLFTLKRGQDSPTFLEILQLDGRNLPGWHQWVVGQLSMLDGLHCFGLLLVISMGSPLEHGLIQTGHVASQWSRKRKLFSFPPRPSN